MVLSYIKKNWSKSIRNGYAGKGLPLPYPYTVPCPDERFTNFFYWDTYFTNLGLLYDDIEQAKHNINNMQFFVDELGYIPNENVEVMFNHSQPPLYPHAVMDYYQKTKDIDFVSKHYPTIKKEYAFWMENRLTALGLNQYNSSPTKEQIEFYYGELNSRGLLSVEHNKTDEDILHYIAESESGWDFSPRFNGKALDYIQVDLNAILYKTETILSEFAGLLGKKEEEQEFLAAATRRKTLMETYCRDKNGLFHDYNFKTGEQSDLITVASMLPFAFGISDDKTACIKTLTLLEFEHGVAAGEKKTGGQGFQWAYPNMWAPLVYWVYEALIKLALVEDADRVCYKYLQTVEKNFCDTSKLLEKYDVITGLVSNIEYESPAMMGWIAGVYVYLKKQKHNGKGDL